ncbi:triphosphoribosyl-dephospho-CoA synthase [Methylobacterium persicinum]|uniref:Triphosphoribosyl-dephospho-CoA synthase n=1 Tax=Methylobacterium persicinum TaxID=374426 RepID=A0ABU0HGQ8_9HYPH|nr:triphosphoribosyl-dephospho-CoA synthase [Methylobacterium persicinum]MDQ0440935.1 triphosphoribosyl-dephospho-CoA synthase [Methylobacterium persicinum]GJE39915.1 2-(5''-triphosphoribosyl)-3'-dephosphocoenzyme-A synthase [Methylobacterium persicinum]
MLHPERIAGLYRDACHAELDALKVGNVHAYAAGHRMEVADFARSAEVSAGPLAEAGSGVGARVLGGVAATREAVGQNTNLGILLLCAPLALAAEEGITLAAALGRLGPEDARDVFAAIRLASPGGLGQATRYDVTAEEAEPPPLSAAMAEAAPRDRIARAYVTAFEDVREVGLPALEAARAVGLDAPWSASAVHLAYLAAFPDSHVLRKHGEVTARAVRDRAAALRAEIDMASRPVAALLAFDTELKEQGINPGTSADFTVATLFWRALVEAGASLG